MTLEAKSLGVVVEGGNVLLMSGQFEACQLKPPSVLNERLVDESPIWPVAPVIEFANTHCLLCC